MAKSSIRSWLNNAKSFVKKDIKYGLHSALLAFGLSLISFLLFLFVKNATVAAITIPLFAAFFTLCIFNLLKYGISRFSWIQLFMAAVLYDALAVAYVAALVKDYGVSVSVLVGALTSIPLLYLGFFLFVALSVMLKPKKKPVQIASVVVNYLLVSFLVILLFGLISFFIAAFKSTTIPSSLSQHILQSALIFWNIFSPTEGGRIILSLVESIISTIVHVIFVAVAVNRIK